jgi:CDP-6-deoxy-D-xylo-4-hexulose-3-dehydrase
MKDLLFRVSGELKNTDFIMENTFWIGLYPGLNFQHLEYAVNKFREYFKSK